MSYLVKVSKNAASAKARSRRRVCAALTWGVWGLAGLLAVLIFVRVVVGSQDAPQATTVSVGAISVPVGAVSGQDAPALSSVRRFRVTAYCPGACCCAPHADGITASGTKADHPLVAAPRTIPFGTRMRIPGYAGGGWVKVEDRGGAIKGDRLDVFYATHEEALRWGVRTLEVEVANGG